jgi:general stress protein YciG
MARGFAAMTVEQKREIASKGGKTAHALGVAHKWTPEEAQAAGRKGGAISRRSKKGAPTDA